MLSIGQFAQLAQVSPRTVRYYESIGLIKSSGRGENNYRYYDSGLVDKVARIRDLQGLGFSLDEIKDILTASSDLNAENLRKKLEEVSSEIGDLQQRRERLLTLLSVSLKIDSQESLNDTERTFYMNAVQSDILEKLESKHGKLSPRQLQYLERDRLNEDQDLREFITAIKRCIQFAKENNLRLGPVRGGASSSMVLHALGLSSFDPSEHDLFPERLFTAKHQIHIDVEYERGQPFVNFCKEISAGLKYGVIEAFKMPLLDILNNVDARLGTPLDYNRIDDNSPLVMDVFHRADLEKVFHFDMSVDALIMKFENFKPGYAGLGKITEYLGSQKIHNFRDVMNIISLWRPNTEAMIARLEQYRQAKDHPVVHEALSQEMREVLRPNFGMILYHEDILRIIAHYTGWEFAKCNQLRYTLLKSEPTTDFAEFTKLAPKPLVDLVVKEIPYAFCLPHIFAHSFFTKATAVLANQHREIYFEEIKKWEAKNGFRWDDIGVAWKGVSIHQN